MWFRLKSIKFQSKVSQSIITKPHFYSRQNNSRNINFHFKIKYDYALKMSKEVVLLEFSELDADLIYVYNI